MPERCGRSRPFDLVLGEIGAQRFPPIRATFERDGLDPFDRNRFSLTREVAELLHDLRPEEGLGDGMSELVAFVHASYLYWASGAHHILVSTQVLDEVAAELAVNPKVNGSPGPRAYYLQLPSHQVWGAPIADERPEPLDGWFATLDAWGLRLVAIFGLQPARAGFTVAEVAGAAPVQPAQLGSAFEGEAGKKLLSLRDGGELLDLGWRLHRIIEAGQFTQN